VEEAESSCGNDSEESERILEAVRQNALMTAKKLRSSGPILKKLVEKGDLLVAAALYDIETGIVTLLEK
jgi:carbonic anhydrase